jgi:hypothetical protein
MNRYRLSFYHLTEPACSFIIETFDEALALMTATTTKQLGSYLGCLVEKQETNEWVFINEEWDR